MQDIWQIYYENYKIVKNITERIAELNVKIVFFEYEMPIII